MKHAFLISVFALTVTACGSGGDTDTESVAGQSEAIAVETQSEEQSSGTMMDQPSAIPESLNAEDKVLIMVDRLVPEPAACLVMISVINGTETTVNAGLFAFNVTGNGESAGANMFPQTVTAGEMKTAQIVLPSAGCDNAKRIEGGQLNCLNPDTGETCLDAVELRDGIIDFTAND